MFRAGFCPGYSSCRCASHRDSVLPRPIGLEHEPVSGHGAPSRGIVLCVGTRNSCDGVCGNCSGSKAGSVIHGGHTSSVSVRCGVSNSTRPSHSLWADRQGQKFVPTDSVVEAELFRVKASVLSGRCSACHLTDWRHWRRGRWRAFLVLG